MTDHLDRLVITIPADLRMLRVLYWSFCLLAGIGGMAASLSWTGAADLLVLSLSSTAGVLILFVAWRLLSAMLRLANRSRASALICLLLVLAAGTLPLLLAGGGGPAFAVLFCSIAMYWALLRALSQNATLSIDQANLTIRKGSSGQVLPLEDIDDAVRIRSWHSPSAQLGPHRVPILSGLTEPEWDWLSEVVLDQAARRRRQLADSGHDLQASATPPEALLALRGTGRAP